MMKKEKKESELGNLLLFVKELERLKDQHRTAWTSTGKRERLWQRGCPVRATARCAAGND